MSTKKLSRRILIGTALAAPSVANSSMLLTGVGDAGVSAPVSPGPFSADVLAQSSLAAFWPLIETVGTSFVDQKSGFNAAISGGVALNNTKVILSDTGKGALFNGSTGYAALASSTQLNYEYTQAFTVEVAFSISSVPSNGTEWFLLTKQNSGSGYTGWAVAIIGTGGGNWVAEALLVNNNATHQMYTKSTVTHGTGDFIAQFSFAGTGTVAGTTIFVNGAKEVLGNIIDTLAGNSILTSTVVSIGVRGGAGTKDGYFNGVLQYISVYTGVLPNATAGQTNNDQVPLFHWSMKNGRTAPTASLPVGVPNVFWGNDPLGDADNPANWAMAAIAHNAGQINLIGGAVNDTLVSGASLCRAYWDHFGASGVEIVAQQTSTPTSGAQQWAATGNAVADRWRPLDATDSGCTALGSIGTAGTGFAVGDILTAVGGVFSANSIARPLKVQVATLGVGNSVATVSIYDGGGGYSTAPVGAVAFIGGTGSAFTLSGPTWTTRKGNFSPPLQFIRRTIYNSLKPVVWAENGLCNNLALFMNSPANSGGDGLPSGMDIIIAKIAYLAIVGGWTPSDVAIGQSPQFNFTVDPVSAHDVFANWPGTIIMGGLELTTINPGTSAYIVSGPDAALNPATNPLKDTFNQYFTDGNTPLLIPNTTVGGAADFSTPMLDLIQSGAAAIGSSIRWGVVDGTYAVDAATAASGYSSYTAGKHSMIRKATADSVYAALANARLATP